MSSLSRRLTLTTAALALSAGGAFADITPQDVWAAMRNQMESMGYEVTFETAADTPQSLVLSSVRSVVAIPDGGSVEMDMGGMRFDADGSGGVTGDFGGLTMAMTVANVTGETFEASLGVEGAGLELQYSGTPDAIEGAFNWPVATYRLTGLRVEGKDIDATGAVTASGAKGTYRYVTSDGGQSIESEIAVGRVDVEGEFHDPAEEPSDLSLNMSVSDLAATASGVQANFLMGNIPEGDGASRVTYGAGDMTVAISGQEGDLTLRAGVSSGHIASGMSGGALTYSDSSNDFQMSAEGSIMPIPPVSVKIASTETDLRIPLTASEDPQDFALKLVFDGLELSDTVWALFDPTAMLSHDPATLSLDASGQAVLSVDLATLTENPEAMADGPPGEMRSVALNGLLVRAMGAELSASGQGEFPPGFPFPLGSVDINASGVMTLIQNLTQLGLLDPGSAGMAQMSLGMFAKPGDGPDTWVSKIEMTMDKGLLVNGQPMQ